MPSQRQDEGPLDEVDSVVVEDDAPTYGDFEAPKHVTIPTVVTPPPA
jgi:hypothetical protein